MDIEPGGYRAMERSRVLVARANQKQSSFVSIAPRSLIYMGKLDSKGGGLLDLQLPTFERLGSA